MGQTGREPKESRANFAKLASRARGAFGYACLKSRSLALPSFETCQEGTTIYLAGFKPRHHPWLAILFYIAGCSILGFREWGELDGVGFLDNGVNRPV